MLNLNLARRASGLAAGFFLMTGAPGCRAQTAASASAQAVAPLDQPFLFSYGTWDKKAQITGGVIHLDADGMTPKGGAGLNKNLDLHADASDSPALRIAVGPRNTLKTLKLMLQDTSGKTGTWVFSVPAPTGGPVTLTPADGASFDQPNETGKGGAPDLSKIMQWQMMGDWGGDGPVDIQVAAILAQPPDAALQKARGDRKQKDAAAAEQARKDRLAARSQYAPGRPTSPTVQAVYAAAPDLLGLQIVAGKITEPMHLSAYTPQPGDQKKQDGGVIRLIRGGQEIGYLIGPKRDGLVTDEGYAGDPLLTAEADDAANYRITSPDDPAFAAGVTPERVMRKAKPDDWQQVKRSGIVMRHTVYLRLPHALTPGKTYTVTFANLNTRQPKMTFAFDPARAWSESVHVDQIGFRPDDPAKRAFLSLWTGSGGYEFPNGLTFHVVDAETGRSVFTGHAGTPWPADKPEQMHTARNFNDASVTPLDFSSLATPGRYRVEVDGVGCSYPFEIGPKVWAKAFWVQMKGFYNQRSGVEVGPPYSEFKKPADFRPGVNECPPITQSSYSNLDGGDGQKDLAKGDTGVPVPGAWGGYHDAGDWNPRRITHMRTTTFWQLELLQLFPDYYKTVSLTVPNDAPGPDLLKECQFELGLFRRLQKPDGGVPFGIETNGDPNDGEVSWKQSMPAYVYAPDCQSSYVYAQVAARAASVLAAYSPAEAKAYRESALNAMAWAEADRKKRQANGTWAKLGGDVTEDRNLAAACLLSLTHDPRWNAVFLEDSEFKADGAKPFYGSLMRRDAAFTYARLPQGVGDAAVKARARRALIADADGALAYQGKNAWGIASDDPGKPQFLGFYSTPHGAVSLVRAYTLTHDAKYLSGAVADCAFSGGANPNNQTYTSGLGANPTRHPLNLDSRETGQATPIGITVYGNVDLQRWGDQSWITWPFTYVFGNQCQPYPTAWPTTEAYFDVFFMPALNELTMDQTMGPNAYVWGYLAARK